MSLCIRVTGCGMAVEKINYVEHTELSMEHDSKWASVLKCGLMREKVLPMVRG